ncbi:MAG: hypothetical protein AAGF11_51705 [Myxococcota bacterium]
MSHRLLSSVPWCLVALTLVGCQNDDRIVVPNRVLDRPLDVVLACVRDGDDQVEVLSLNQCDGADTSDCQSGTPQLIGFVANSERNELAMFRRCDRDAALVDMDPEAPGYNFLPAGHLPSALTITNDSCRAVAANAGSCDLTVLDVAGLGAYAVDNDLTAEEASALPSPSTLVSTLVPRRSDGRPLGSSPGEILAVPSALTQAGNAAPDPVDDAGEAGDAGDDGTPIPEGNLCDLNQPASVYVTFPSCQLVAEVSLTTQTVLQSRQFVTNEQGEIELVDTGPEPLCPVDCPAPFEGDLPEEIELVDPSGVFPTALALVTPPSESSTPDLAEAEVEYASLFVGGPGSDRVFEIEIEPDGRFSDVVESVLLEDAQGVQTIRVTPAANVPPPPLGGETNAADAHQFLYVIAGDGSTHVIDRDFDPGSLGIECDTQIDPTLEDPTPCHEIDPGQASNAIDRRPFAVGPGIRAPGGTTINDWTFHKVSTEEAGGVCGAVDDVEDGEGQEQQLDPDDFRTPFCQPSSLVGVGVTSLGTVVYSTFGQFGVDQTLSRIIDPVELISIQVRPHSLWPALDPLATDPVAEALPLVADEEPGRGIPGGGVDAQTLAPSLRQVDLAYSTQSGDSDEQQAVASALGNPGNVDALGGGLYENAAARVAVRDFQQWNAQTWTLEWEPMIPGTTSGTGLLQCDRHGSVDDNGNEVAGGTCRNTEPDDARLVDESANFCEDGVLSGDLLEVLGCNDDDNCGLGQRCLRDPTAPTTATGICISATAYDDAEERNNLRDLCAPFIRDPCGSATREYRITYATNEQLWITALDRPERTVVRDMAQEDEPPDLREYVAKLSCEVPVGRQQPQECAVDADCLADPYDPDNSRGEVTCQVPEGESSGSCVGRQPDGGCNDDEDCAGLGAQYLCVDSVCRAPCDLCPPAQQPDEPCRTDDDCVAAEAGEVCMAGTCHERCTDGNPGCLRSPLPGPRCFPELVRYAVRLHESFAFFGSSTPFLTARVVTDAETGECIEDQAVSNLLSSRIRLGADAARTFGTGPWQIPECVSADQAGPDEPNPCRLVVDRSADPTSRFHTFRYRGEPVAAIRYSNPLMSVVIDLVSLTGLTSEPPDFADQSWPASFARFLRARIPDGYREEFASANGFVPFNEGVVVGQNPLVYPVRIVRGPEPDIDFIVDAGGRGGVSGVRGQVVRIEHDLAQVVADSVFRVQ